jgi:ZIP family zinc transporter
MIVFLLALAASFAAAIGSYTAIRSRRQLDTALALTAGLVLGLVTFDLLPEIFDIVQSQKLDPVWPMIALTAGFLLFHIFEKSVPVHEATEQDYGPHRHPRLGTARAVALSGHSFLDGLSIGVAFQVSTAVGLAVALAVIGHRFMLFHKNKLSHIKRWLAVVVLMPIAGGLASLTFSLSESALAIYLGFFAGLILYISASNLLPQAHSQQSGYRATGLTVLGVAFMFLVTRFV